MSSGFSFGAGSTNPPAFGQTSTFGAPAASSPFASTFGSTAQKSFNFASPQPTSSAAPAFGSTFNAGSATGQSTFGMPTAGTTPGFGFNAAASTPTNAFGAAAQQPQQATPSFFGAPTASTANSTNALGFGAPASQGTGISFGTPTRPAAPAFGSSTFGTPQPPSFGAPSFGAVAAPATGGLSFGTPTQPTAGLGFGAPAATTTGGFGAPAATTTGGFGFGAVPNASAAPGGLSFGTPTSSAAGGFGFPQAPAASTTQSFGQPAVPASGGLTFGATASMPNTGLTFGTPALSANTGLNFAAPAASSASGGLTFGAPVSSAPAFGAPAASTISSGISFGSTPVAASIAGTLPSSFGASPTMSARGGGFPLGAPASTAPGFSLGQTTATSQAAAPLQFPTSTATTKPALSFNLPSATTQTTGISFAAASTAAPKPLFSIPTATTAAAPATSSTASGFANLAAATSTPTTGISLLPTATTAGGLNFNMPATSTTLGGFSLAGSTPATSAPASASASISLGFDLQSKLPTTAAPAFSTAATTTTKVGLGGISAALPKSPATSIAATTAPQPEIAPRDQPLPNELLQTVDSFKKHLQEQKNHISEIARFSITDLKTVENDINLVNKKIGEMENELQRNKVAAERLKLDSSEGLKQVDMAQRTFNTPAGLQYNNTAPMTYFLELADNFERQMQTLKISIQHIDKSMSNKSRAPPSLTSQDLTMGMRRLHETFVALAGRLQILHNQVEQQKEQYLEMRKQVFRDHTNVFESKSTEMEALEIVLDNITSKQPAILSGPTPFSPLGNSQAQSLATQNPPPQPPSYPYTAGAPIPGFHFAKPPTRKQPPNQPLLFGGNTSYNSTNASFQLQEPPVGNKRGKLIA